MGHPPSPPPCATVPTPPLPLILWYWSSQCLTPSNCGLVSLSHSWVAHLRIGDSVEPRKLWQVIRCRGWCGCYAQDQEMATPKITWKIFTCITIHQTFVPPEPWIRHSTSTSTIMGYHYIRIFPIPINKQQLIRSQTYKNKTALSRALKVQLIKNTTIHLSTAPKSNAKLITYMNIDNIFNLLVGVLFSMSPQLGVIWPKSQDLVI